MELGEDGYMAKRIYLSAILVTAYIALAGCAHTQTRESHSWKGSNSPIGHALHDLKNSGQSVIIAILGDVDTEFSSEYYENQGLDLNHWKKGAYQDTLALYEERVTEAFRNIKDFRNFKLVDRATIEKELQELKLSESGAITEQNRVQVGKLLGATHLIIFHLMESPTKTSTIDTYTSRLINVESGEVLASQIYSTEK